MLNLYSISGSHSCCESVCLRRCGLPGCLSVRLSETSQTLGCPSKGWKKSGKFVGMYTFIHWILCNSAELLGARPSWRERSSCFLAAGSSGSLHHGLSFRLQVRGLP